MSNSVSNNNNNDFSISELQKKLVNIEETAMDGDGMKSIFSVYNVNQQDGDNSIEFLDKNELTALVNDIKKYDNDGNGTIDIDEANMFVREFNAGHPDKKIKSDDFFGFVKNIFKRYDYYNDNKSSESNSEFLGVGEPLSENTYTMKCVIDGKVETIVINIKLYATNDKKYLHQYGYEVVQGREFKKAMAAEYGFYGNDGFEEFMNHSLGKPDPRTYQVNFNPQFSTTMADDGGRVNPNTAWGQVDGVENVLAVPHGFSKDPRITLAEYNNPEAQETMNRFIEYLEETIASAEKNLEEVLAQEGFTGWLADVISHIWNNKYSPLNTGNTESQMREMLDAAKAMLEKFKNEQDNSLEGIMLRKDFGAYFKEFTNGVEFDYRKVKNFLDEQKDYIRKESVLSTYHYVHNYMDNVINNFQSANKDQKYQEMIQKAVEIEKSLGSLAPKEPIEMELDRSGRVENNYKKTYDDLYNMFNSFIGISREDWDAMFEEFKQQGKDPMEFINNFANIITTSVDKATMSALGLNSLSKIDEYEEQMQKNYNYVKSDAVGRDGDLLRRIDDYHSSQIIGSAVVSGIAQLALYSWGLSVLGNVASISSGMASGLSYSGSYLAVEVADRLTNGIDNSEDLYSFDAIFELAGNAGVEFAAGHLFDGILKAKYFGKAEKAALDAEKMDFTAVGEAFLNSPGKKFSSETITRILGVRGVAACVGSAKDGTKEIFKESLKRDYSLSDIGAAFIVGAISNAFFIRFKNASFAKKDHKIMGKFLEKSPKKGVKNDLKSSQEVLDNDEQQAFNSFLSDIRKSIMEDLKKHLNEAGYSEVETFLENNADDVNKIIINMYVLEYVAQYGGN